jgi:hypothetical protein
MRKSLDFIVKHSDEKVDTATLKRDTRSPDDYIAVVYLLGGPNGRRPPEILIRPPENIHSDASTR